MTQPHPHAPKHRQPAARRAPRTALRTLVVLSSLAVVGTGTALAGGTLSMTADAGAGAPPAGAATAVMATPQLSGAEIDQSVDQGATDALKRAAAAAAADTARRAPIVSRSDRRGVADPAKQAALSLQADGNAMTRSEDLSDEDPRTVARALMAEQGFSSDQFGCLDSLWTRESGWSVTADNPSSSAYGIPQALPGSKMSSFGADWATNPVTQIRWGLDYISDRYGSPCGAWGHSQSNGWY